MQSKGANAQAAPVRWMNACGEKVCIFAEKPLKAGAWLDEAFLNFYTQVVSDRHQT